MTQYKLEGWLPWGNITDGSIVDIKRKKPIIVNLISTNDMTNIYQILLISKHFYNLPTLNASLFHIGISVSTEINILDENNTPIALLRKV